MKRLPDAEFAIMKVVWANDPPITTNMVMEQLGKERNWKAQTVISFMLRLVDRDFLRTEKDGKERVYYPLVSREAYLKYETDFFLRQYHESSFLSLVNTLYDDDALTGEDIAALIRWAEERRVEHE